jgi:competence protein ComEC
MPLERIRSARKIKPFIVLILIWLFTILTGAGASIVRAAVMFSLISIAQQINRKISLLNSLFCSAFILLYIDPFLLWDLGFQLSYAAVASIALFDQPIRNLWRPENKSLQIFWNLTAITLAAQLCTLPLCLFHFHQFPTLFLPANLIAVPLSTLILYGLIILLMISWFPEIAKYWGILTDQLISFLNNWVHWLHRFTFSTIDGIVLCSEQAICLYGIIIGIFFSFNQKKKAGFYIIALFTLLYFSFEHWYRFRAKKSYTLRVYQVRFQTAVEFSAGNRLCIWGNQLHIKKLLEKDGILQLAHQVLRLDGNPYVLLDSSSTSIQLGTKQILLIHEVLPMNIKKNYDLAVLTCNPKGSLPDFIHQSGVKMIIADNSNKTQMITEWRAVCEKKKIIFFPTAERGAFEMRW